MKDSFSTEKTSRHRTSFTQSSLHIVSSCSSNHNALLRYQNFLTDNQHEQNPVFGFTHLCKLPPIYLELLCYLLHETDTQELCRND
uniref:Uncharacterized protein MANES_10G051000 n=1 Tax=Rhizophora mucronata TaxID=61149 RepID=A0A2P2KKZ3_RHIMU